MSDGLSMRNLYLKSSEEVRDKFVSTMIVADIAQRLGTPVRPFLKQERNKAKGPLKKLISYLHKNQNRQRLMDAVFEEKMKELK